MQVATGRVFDRAKGDPSLLPDAFPCAADADALPEAHDWQNAVGVSHGTGLVPDFVVFHPVFDLLVGHVEVALLLVERGHLCHFFFAEFKVEDLYVLLDVLWVGGAGNHAEAFLDVPADDDLRG